LIQLVIGLPSAPDHIGGGIGKITNPFSFIRDTTDSRSGGPIDGNEGAPGIIVKDR
jgi:hypothetical protein